MRGWRVGESGGETEKAKKTERLHEQATGEAEGGGEWVS